METATPEAVITNENHADRPGPLMQLLSIAGKILLLTLCLVLVQHAREDELTPDIMILLGLFSMTLGASLWQSRQSLIRTFCSIQFAIVLLVAIAAGTALGTFVPQHASIAEIEERFGEALSTWIDRFFLTEVFTSLWYVGLMVLLVLSLLLVVVRRQFWRLQQLGFALTHGGMIAVIVGAAIGAAYGQRGVIQMRKGEERNALAVTETVSAPD